MSAGPCGIRAVPGDPPDCDVDCTGAKVLRRKTQGKLEKRLYSYV